MAMPPTQPEPIANASSLPQRHYTSESIFRQEMEGIFYERWLCVGRTEQVAKPGEYFLQRVGEESLLILQERSGQVRAYYNVCRHRGSRLCTMPSGQLSETIQCPYHAWTYALDGRLIGAPHMNEVPGFDKAAYPLIAISVEVWEGFIFIHLSRQPEPFERAFAPLVGKFARWHLPELCAGHRIEYDVQANWKLLFENYNECYHCPLVHPALAKLSPYHSGSNDLVEGPFLGGPMLLQHGTGSLTVSGMTCSEPIGEVSGEDLERVYYYSIFPNMFLSLHPDYALVHTLWPQEVDRTHVVCEWLFDPAAMAQPDFRGGEAIQFWDVTNRQDWHVCELVQQGIHSRAYTPGPYSTLETIPAAFDREVLRSLSHFE